MKEQFNKVLNDISNIVGRNKSFNHKIKNGLFDIYWGIKVNNMIDFKIIYILNKIIDLIKLGHTITILIADIHTILNNTTISIENETKKFITNLWELIDSYKLLRINSILGSILLIGYLRVSINITIAVNEIIKTRIILSKLKIFFGFLIFFRLLTGLLLLLAYSG